MTFDAIIYTNNNRVVIFYCFGKFIISPKFLSSNFTFLQKRKGRVYSINMYLLFLSYYLLHFHHDLYNPFFFTFGLIP